MTAARSAKENSFLDADGLTEPHRIATSKFRHLYWTMARQLSQLTPNGCNVRPGDLVASGTISGPEPDTPGSLRELTWRGTRPMDLPGGLKRCFLENGDTVTITG